MSGSGDIYRVDGFTAPVNTIIVTISAGIGQSIILGGLSAFGYISPASIGATAETVINQPASAQNFMTWMYVGVPMIGYLIIALILSLYDLEDKLPQITKDITARHKAEAEARGEVYISAEERKLWKRQSRKRKQKKSASES